MPVALSETSDGLQIAVSGHFDFCLKPHLEQALRVCCQRPQAASCELDLGAVSYLDATALTLIHQFAQSLQDAGAQLTLKNPTKDSLRLLKAGGLEALLREPGQVADGRFPRQP